MTPVVVCDASVLVAALVDSGDAGRWAGDVLADAHLVAPTLAKFEAANVVRRLERAGVISADTAAQAFRDMVDLPLEEWPFATFAERCWQLRGHLTFYDASYIALAETLDASVATLDQRLARAAGAYATLLVP